MEKPLPTFLTIKAAAKHSGLSVPYMYSLLQRKQGPAFHNMSNSPKRRCIRIRIDDLEEWLKSRRQENTECTV